MVGAKRRPGGAGKASRANFRQDLIQTISHQKVVIPQGKQALSSQYRVADAVFSLTVFVEVRAAIDFHHDTARPAQEIQIVAP